MICNTRTEIKNRESVFIESTVKRFYISTELSIASSETNIQDRGDVEKMDDSISVHLRVYYTITKNESISDGDVIPDTSNHFLPQTTRQLDLEVNQQGKYF